MGIRTPMNLEVGAVHAPKQDGKIPANYADYLLTEEGEKWEMIEGIPLNMSTVPSTEHQMVVSNLQGEFYLYLKGKECRSFVAPFDVRLFAENVRDEEVKTFVQPDISIVCDKNKLDERGCVGAPDLVVEVLSPSTAKQDRSEKMRLYKRAGLKEYWIIDPHNQTLEVYEQQTQTNVVRVYGKNDKVKVGLFADLEIDLQSIFAT